MWVLVTGLAWLAVSLLAWAFISRAIRQADAQDEQEALHRFGAQGPAASRTGAGPGDHTAPGGPLS
jgi:hypothetical protein